MSSKTALSSRLRRTFPGRGTHSKKDRIRRARLIKTVPKRKNPFEFITVEIPTYAQDADTQSWVFHLEIRNSAGQFWKLQKTYSNFRKLHKKLGQRFPGIRRSVHNFPKRNLFPLQPDSPQIEHRRHFFTAYIQALLQLEPRIKLLNDFLEVAKNSSAVVRTNLSIVDFEILKLVGRGAFGKVFLVRVIGTRNLYAMKVLKKSLVKETRQLEHTKVEINVMKKADHPFIVSLRHAFQTESRVFMVTDFCSGGELFFHLREQNTFTIEMTQFYIAEISLAIEYLHENSVVYRDLKPENVLLDEAGHIKLTDFGLSNDKVNQPIGDAAFTFCGTPEYLAPEMLIGKLKKKGYGHSVDWWSVGVLFFEMIEGITPFFNENKKAQLRDICKAKIPGSLMKHPIEVQDVIRGFLTRKPENRLGVKGDGFEEIRTHPFFTEVNNGIDWDALYQLRVSPPFQPQRSSGSFASVVNFNPELTNEPVRLSDEEKEVKNATLNRQESEGTLDDFDDEFEDFNFARPMADNIFESFVM